MAGLCVFCPTALVQLGVLFAFPRWKAVCVCAMSETADGRSQITTAPVEASSAAANAASSSSTTAPVEASSAAGNAASSTEESSDLLKQIKALSVTQKALKDAKKEVRKRYEKRPQAQEALAGQSTSAQRRRLGGGFAYAQG